MPLDAISLRAVVEELRPQLLNLRIDKVQQPARDQVILLLRGNKRLLLNAGANAPRLQLTELLRQAELDARTIVSESETLQLARQKSSEIIRRAEDRSKELYHVANTYTEDALRRTEEAIQAALTEVQESRARFRAASKEQMQAQRQQLNSSAVEKGGDSQQ